MASGGTKITLTTSYQTAYEASTPIGAGSDGQGAHGFFAAASSSTGIVIKVTLVGLQSASASTVHEIPWIDGQVFGYANAERFRRISKIEVKGESAAGTCYIGIAKHF